MSLLTRLLLSALLAALLSPLALAGPVAAAVPDAPSCSTAGTWTPGELNIYWFDVEQGDAQLVVGPTGRTLLVDLGETAWNSKGTTTMATRVAQEIRDICGIASGPVHLDHVMASHHHLDHIGYAGNPEDTQDYGNGIYQLLTPASLGGLGFTVGQLVDRDGGVWTDANGNGSCEVGTSSMPAPEVAWHNVGTTSQTARRWVCWLYGPAGQADRAHIEGRVVRLANDAPWPTFDLGGGGTASVVQANGKGVMQADGSTPVSGDHSAAAVPPSENDYSIGMRVSYGAYAYATAGDSDGEYMTSTYGYTYNDIERSLVAPMGTVETIRANHHGSGHSSSTGYVTSLSPQTGVVSCGSNSYGHPANRTLDAFQGAGADVYLTNNPCDTQDNTGPIDYSGTFNKNGTIHLVTTGGGAGYRMDHDAGSTSYVTGGGDAPGTNDPSVMRINEVLMAPSTGNEWVELHNPSGASVDLTGLYLDDVAGGGGAPKAIPAGTVVPAGGRWVFEMASGFLNNTGSESARLLSSNDAGATVHDEFTWSLGSTQYDKVFHRTGDGGQWCTTISANVTKGTPNPVTCP